MRVNIHRYVATSKIKIFGIPYDRTFKEEVTLTVVRRNRAQLSKFSSRLGFVSFMHAVCGNIMVTSFGWDSVTRFGVVLPPQVA